MNDGTLYFHPLPRATLPSSTFGRRIAGYISVGEKPPYTGRHGAKPCEVPIDSAVFLLGVTRIDTGWYKATSAKGIGTGRIFDTGMTELRPGLVKWQALPIRDGTSTPQGD